MKMATERSANFWNSIEVNVTASSPYKGTKDFSMGGCLDNKLENTVGCELALIGPMLDSFVRKIGKEFVNKLARSKATSIQQSPSIFFPWQIFRSFLKLAAGYGAVIDTRGNKVKSVTSISITFKTEISVRKTWHPRRLGGVNYLAKRKF